MASRSLGPFPKSLHWRDLAGDKSEETLDILIAQYESLTEDDNALKATTFLVALVVCSRAADVAAALKAQYEITLQGEPDIANLRTAIETFIPEDHLVKRALIETVQRITEQPGENLFDKDPWKRWRAYDGSAFCDLARLFFCNVNEQYFTAILDSPSPAREQRALQSNSPSPALGEERGLGGEVQTAAWEFSYITRT